MANKLLDVVRRNSMKPFEPQNQDDDVLRQWVNKISDSANEHSNILRNTYKKTYYPPWSSENTFEIGTSGRMDMYKGGFTFNSVEYTNKYMFHGGWNTLSQLGLQTSIYVPSSVETWTTLNSIVLEYMTYKSGDGDATVIITVDGVNKSAELSTVNGVWETYALNKVDIGSNPTPDSEIKIGLRLKCQRTGIGEAYIGISYLSVNFLCFTPTGPLAALF